MVAENWKVDHNSHLVIHVYHDGSRTGIQNNLLQGWLIDSVKPVSVGLRQKYGVTSRWFALVLPLYSEAANFEHF